MAHFKYSVSQTTCPNCNYVLERKNDFWKTLFFIIFLPAFFIYLIYMLAYWILSEYVLDVYVPKVGKSYYLCPSCGAKLNSGKTPYNQLSDIEKTFYDNRGLFRTAYFFGGTTIISLLLIFFKLSDNPTDQITGTVGIASAVTCFIILILIIIYWKMIVLPKAISSAKSEAKQDNFENPVAKNLNTQNITKSNTVKKDENLTDLANFDNIYIDFTDDDIKNIQSEYAIYTKEKLPDLLKKYKDEKTETTLLDIVKIFIRMYSHNEALLIAMKDTALPIVNTTFGRYLPIYTEEKYFNILAGNNYNKVGFKLILELFYSLNENNMCEGIVINYGTDNMMLFPKISIDNMKFDLFFNVPWKK